MQKSDRGYLSLFSRKKLIFAQKTEKMKKLGSLYSNAFFSASAFFIDSFFTFSWRRALARSFLFFGAAGGGGVSTSFFGIVTCSTGSTFQFLAEKKRKKNLRFFLRKVPKNWHAKSRFSISCLSLETKLEILLPVMMKKNLKKFEKIRKNLKIF